MNRDVGRLPQVPTYRSWLTHSVDANTTDLGPESLVGSRPKGNNSQTSRQGGTGAPSLFHASAKIQPDDTKNKAACAGFIVNASAIYRLSDRSMMSGSESGLGFEDHNVRSRVTLAMQQSNTGNAA